MSNRQDRPLAKKLLHALGLLALALFLLYVAVQFVLIFHRSYKTETAIRYTLAESLNLTGVVAFDAVDVPGSGNLGYLVQDGERVTNGTVVAECYTDDTQGLQRERLDRLERSITLLTKSQNSAGSELSVLTNQTKQALYNLLDKLDTAQYTGISDAQIEEACRACGIYHFIETLPHGFDTVLDDSIAISSGQKQLLTIARTILADNRILILDEATSSVDTRTEQRIQTAMDRLMEGRTSFVIAHRLSTIRDADLILVMRDGDIVEQGTHDQLIEAGGFYADLYNSQFEDVVE